MKTFLPTIKEWRKAGKQIVIARVIKTWNASPRPVGSVLLISDALEMAGSVSGGCVEGAVLKAAKKTFEDGKTQLLEFGVSDDEAWTVGLTCGGRAWPGPAGAHHVLPGERSGRRKPALSDRSRKRGKATPRRAAPEPNIVEPLTWLV